MNKEQALDRIAAIEKEAAELRKIVEQPEGPWVPEAKEQYWFVQRGGDVDTWHNDNTEPDRKLTAVGNCFKTKEEAESFAKFFRESVKAAPPYGIGEEVDFQTIYGDWGPFIWNDTDSDIKRHHAGLVRRIK